MLLRHALFAARTAHAWALAALEARAAGRALFSIASHAPMSYGC